MAFDDSTGGIDRHQHRAPITWGDDWGDRSFSSMWAAYLTETERAEVERADRARYLERRAEIAADATRRRSAPVEARIERERAERSPTAIAKAFREAKARAKKR